MITDPNPGGSPDAPTLNLSYYVDTGNIVVPPPPVVTPTFDSTLPTNVPGDHTFEGNITVDQDFGVVGATTLDNGAITTDGAGNITAVGYAGNGSALTGISISSTGGDISGPSGNVQVNSAKSEKVFFDLWTGVSPSQNAAGIYAGTGGLYVSSIPPTNGNLVEAPTSLWFNAGGSIGSLIYQTSDGGANWANIF